VTAEFYNGNATGAERVTLRNNIFQGQVDFLQPFENTCLIYQETFPSDPFDVDYSIINQVKDDLCPGAHDQCGVAPSLVDTGTDTFDAHLLANSPAIDAGLAGVAPADDFAGYARDAHPDIGAYEYGVGPPRFYLPLIVRAGGLLQRPERRIGVEMQFGPGHHQAPAPVAWRSAAPSAARLASISSRWLA